MDGTRKISITVFLVLGLVFTAAVSFAASEEGPTVIIVGSDENDTREQGEKPAGTAEVRSPVTIIEGDEPAEEGNWEEYEDGESDSGAEGGYLEENRSVEQGEEYSGEDEGNEDYGREGEPGEQYGQESQEE